jgi:hypothetical protein
MVEAIKWGVGSKSSYDRAVKELIEKHYLVKTQDNHYYFYDLPLVANDDIQVTIIKN